MMSNDDDIEIIDVERKNLLKNNLQATDEELKALERLIKIQHKKMNSNGGSRSQPSVIIEDFLYHGDLGHAIDANLLLDFGIRNIINLCDCPLDNEIVNVLWIGDLEDNVQGNIRRYFDKTNDFLIECKKNDEKVLIHCQAGISRSSAIVLAYLIKHNNSSLEEAYDFLLDKRPIASPNYGFLLELIRYEKELRQPAEDLLEQKF